MPEQIEHNQWIIACPHCAEFVRVQAKKCRYCQEKIEPRPEILTNTSHHAQNLQHPSISSVDNTSDLSANTVEISVIIDELRSNVDHTPHNMAEKDLAQINEYDYAKGDMPNTGQISSSGSYLHPDTLIESDGDNLSQTPVTTCATNPDVVSETDDGDVPSKSVILSEDVDSDAQTQSGPKKALASSDARLDGVISVAGNKHERTVHDLISLGEEQDHTMDLDNAVISSVIIDLDAKNEAANSNNISDDELPFSSPLIDHSSLVLNDNELKASPPAVAERIATQAEQPRKVIEIPAISELMTRVAEATKDDLPSITMPVGSVDIDISVSELADSRTDSTDESERIEEEWSIDPIFEELMQGLEDQEFQLCEVLSAVRRSFWEPVRTAFLQLDTRNLQKMLRSMDLSPMRRSIRDMVSDVGASLFATYHQLLEDLAERGIAELRNPFREYVERLEHLDQNAECLILKIEQMPVSQRTKLLSPILPINLKRLLDQRTEARGIESAWRSLLACLRDNALPPHAPVIEIEELQKAMEQFFSQLEPTYSVVLYRIIELWSDRLLSPIKHLFNAEK
jgi:hypothetical protein